MTGNSTGTSRRRPYPEPVSLRSSAPIGAFLVTAIVLFALGPMPQDPSYHDFADSTVLDIPHFAIVATNIAFLVVGIWGLFLLYARRARERPEPFAIAAPYVVFFAGFVLTAFGSAYYHADPTNLTLTWDRAAMTVIFAGITAIYVGDRLDWNIAAWIVLPVLISLGLASQLYVAFGHDDLRLYRLVQYGSILTVVVTCLVLRGRHTSIRTAVWMAFWFGLATVSEHLDREIHQVLGPPLGGHVLKHVLAAIAGIPILLTLPRTRSSNPS